MVPLVYFKYSIGSCIDTSQEKVLFTTYAEKEKMGMDRHQDDLVYPWTQTAT